jgi:hypothetical protein
VVCSGSSEVTSDPKVRRGQYPDARDAATLQFGEQRRARRPCAGAHAATRPANRRPRSDAPHHQTTDPDPLITEAGEHAPSSLTPSAPAGVEGEERSKAGMGSVPPVRAASRWPKPSLGIAAWDREQAAGGETRQRSLAVMASIPSFHRHRTARPVR